MPKRKPIKRPARRTDKERQVEHERKRATEAEQTKRIDTLFGLLVSGTRRAEILQFSAETWHLEERQTDEYIAAATALIKAEAAKTQEESFAEHVAFRRQVRKRAMSDEDWRAALDAAKDEAKLRNLYPEIGAPEHPLTVNVIDLENVRKKRWQESVAQIAQAIGTPDAETAK